MTSNLDCLICIIRRSTLLGSQCGVKKLPSPHKPRYQKSRTVLDARRMVRLSLSPGSPRQMGAPLSMHTSCRELRGTMGTSSPFIMAWIVGIKSQAYAAGFRIDSEFLLRTRWVFLHLLLRCLEAVDGSWHAFRCCCADSVNWLTSLFHHSRAAVAIMPTLRFLQPVQQRLACAVMDASHPCSRVAAMCLPLTILET